MEGDVGAPEIIRSDLAGVYTLHAQTVETVSVVLAGHIDGGVGLGEADRRRIGGGETGAVLETTRVEQADHLVLHAGDDPEAQVRMLSQQELGPQVEPATVRLLTLRAIARERC